MTEQTFLKEYNPEHYDRISVATDIVSFSVSEEAVVDHREVAQKTFNILLIKRGEHPFKDCWALPGGFVQKDETVIEAARRELTEETGVTKAYIEEIGTWSEVCRDPRMRIISIAHLALLNHKPQLQASTDAAETAWFKVDFKTISSMDGMNDKQQYFREEVFELTLRNQETELFATLKQVKLLVNGQLETSLTLLKTEGLAFDHAQIIVSAILHLRQKISTSEEIVFNLLPIKFSIKHLQQIYELILDTTFDTGNFRKKIKNLVIPTEERDYSGSRKSVLYMQNLKNTLFK